MYKKIFFLIVLSFVQNINCCTDEDDGFKIVGGQAGYYKSVLQKAASSDNTEIFADEVFNVVKKIINESGVERHMIYNGHCGFLTTKNQKILQKLQQKIENTTKNKVRYKAKHQKIPIKTYLNKPTQGSKKILALSISYKNKDHQVEYMYNSIMKDKILHLQNLSNGVLKKVFTDEDRSFFKMKPYFSNYRLINYHYYYTFGTIFDEIEEHYALATEVVNDIFENKYQIEKVEMRHKNLYAITMSLRKNEDVLYSFMKNRDTKYKKKIIRIIIQYYHFKNSFFCSSIYPIKKIIR